MQTSEEDKQKLQQLRELLARSRGRRQGGLSEAELRSLPQLYRFASSLYARLETRGNDSETLDQARDLLRRAHAVLYRGAGHERLPWHRALRQLFFVKAPRALRSEWRLLGFSLLVFYTVAIAAFVAVSDNLELAFTLFDPQSVATEISQLESTPAGEPFRGNFTFGTESSSRFAGLILAHNIGVSVVLFASGLLLPLYIYLLTMNALMLGVYTAVATHWDQASAISSILWCHGVLEIQAIIIAGMAGIVLLRAWVAPGPWSRTHAMRLELPRALHVFAPTVPMLIIAGLIEGFISPHASTEIRMGVALVTGIAFLGWLFLAGRGTTERTALASRSRS